jgi:broad specificity phosphatase PhoE
MTDQSIYLVRDGETAFNADGRLRGLADPDLNAAGLGQANSWRPLSRPHEIRSWSPVRY